MSDSSPSFKPVRPAASYGRGAARFIARARAEWGKRIKRTRDFEGIGRFHRMTSSAASVVDDQTWGDLGMDDVFAAVDGTVSVPGRQILYDQLRTIGVDDAVLAERTPQRIALGKDREARESLQVQLHHLNGPAAEHMAHMVCGHFPAPSRMAWIYILLAILTPSCVMGVFFLHALLLPALVLALVNVGVYLIFSQRIAPYFSGLAQADLMLKVGVDLSRDANPHALPQIEFLKKDRSLLKMIRRRLGWLVMDREGTSEVGQWILGYLNFVFLLDPIAFNRATRILQAHRPVLEKVFRALGSLDAAIAAASFQASLPASAVPERASDRRLEFVDVYHPLIPDAVANSFSLVNESALIAGPNMAGKTAFIRTIGVNLLLSQTLHLVLAKRAVLARATVQSAIRREDRLSDGESYFFAELKRIQEFTAADTGPLRLFLIDEIFRGTNTAERIAISAAVLEHLGARHLVMATTHDHQLEHLLGGKFCLYHFNDQVVDGRYGFDYQIRRGPADSRNAIRLLEVSGYPACITEHALRLIELATTTPSAQASLTP